MSPTSIGFTESALYNDEPSWASVFIGELIAKHVCNEVKTIMVLQYGSNA